MAITAQRPRAWLELADDNTFALQREHEPLLDLLRTSGTRWFTESDWRLGTQPKLCESLAESGCQQVLVGMESTVFQYPGMGAKRTNWDAMMDATAAIQGCGVVVNACFIVGADGETQASIRRLTEFLCTAPFGEVQVTLQTPFPGTPLYRQLERDGRLRCTDFTKHTLFDVTYQPRDLLAEDLQTAFHELVACVYSREQQSRRAEVVKSIKRTCS
ncbi:MAG: hypothetical protein AAGD07_09860 [Planctomycetota bacterium]